MTRADLIAALEAAIARAERAEAERDKLMMEIQWVASIAGISGPKEEIAKAVGDVVIERGKWQELAREAEDFAREMLVDEPCWCEINRDAALQWLAKMKELEGEKP